MPLAARLADLIVAVGADIKALFGRVMPAGGTTGQVLAKSSDTDYAVAWVTPAAGGGGGGGNVYIQETDPAVASPYIWFKTDATGVVIDILKG